MKPLIITAGDPEGIGPEVVWKTLKNSRQLRQNSLCIGSAKAFGRLKAKLLLTTMKEVRSEVQLSSKSQMRLIPTPETRSPGYQSGWAIEVGTQLVLDGFGSALVTGPIHKDRLMAAGFPYPGHTEFLAKLCGVERVTMMLANSKLRVSLVTTHIPLNQVSQSLNEERILLTCKNTLEVLRDRWGIARPKIAVLALNPHAGEGGRLGSEEESLIAPALVRAKQLYGKKAQFSGPWPADTFFALALGSHPQIQQDATICLYHDQGLIPVKMIDFARTVNVTLGLPIIRTSVDHGTAFDIAGKGIADPSSFKAAAELALQWAKRLGGHRGKRSV